MLPKSLEAWLNKEGIKYEVYLFEKPVKSVSQACAQTGCPYSDFVKTLIFLTPTTPIACIIPGEKTLNVSKLANTLGLEKSEIRICPRSEVEKNVGFPAGGVPPVGLQIPIYVDKGVMKKDYVIGGGGNTKTLLKIPTEELLKSPNAKLATLC